MRKLVLFLGAAVLATHVCAASAGGGVLPEVIYSFKGAPGDGAQPRGGVALADGSLFGVTQYGGLSDMGTIYRLSAGKEDLLHQFTGDDGAAPSSLLLLGADGLLYGTTLAGGPLKGGTVFRMASDGTNFSTVAWFADNEGFTPHLPGGLTFGKGGALFGILEDDGIQSRGAIFRILHPGRAEIVHRFSEADGWAPRATMVLGSDGWLYGTTSSAGQFNLGTIYRFNVRGTFQVLHSFSANEGADASSALYEVQPGVFYGVNATGGQYNGGTAYRISSMGAFKLIHDFGKTQYDAQQPSSGLVLGADGQLYGTTSGGGNHGLGSLYRMDQKGHVVVVASFNGFDGKLPNPDRLVVDSAGNLLGTCYSDGDLKGNVFSVTP